MALSRRLARPLLASVFVASGIDVLRNPEGRVKKADPFLTEVREMVPLPEDTELLVKVNAGVMLGAGALLALGKLPRLSALLLAASLVPTTAAGHRFWEEAEPQSRAQQQVHFMKNLGLLGGLLLAAVDTEGAPSLGWRARRAAAKAASRTSEVAGLALDALPVIG